MSTKATKSKKKRIGIFIVCMVLLVAVLSATAVGYVYIIAKPKAVVAKAEALMEQGGYIDAYLALNNAEIVSWFGSEKLTEKATELSAKKEALAEEHPTVLFYDAKVGDVITFGRFEQDGDDENGQEPLEWLVLDVDETNGRLLVISLYCIDCQRFRQEDVKTSWSESNIRKWLNKKDGKYAFYGNAFNQYEQACIVSKTISVPLNPEYKTGSLQTATDRLFLLSAQEAEQYFADDAARVCEPTLYARTRGSYVPSGKSSCRWWLRTSGETTKKAVFVGFDGAINLAGMSVIGTGDYAGSDRLSVRPAMWIQIEYPTE